MNSITSIITSIFVAAALCTGCVSSDKDWKEAAAAQSAQGSAQPATAPVPGGANAKSQSQVSVEGAWEGKWHSDSGHGENRLRCVMEKAGEGKYRARFIATTFGPFEMKYTVMFTAVPEDGKVKISGKEDLGWLVGGEYRYEGEITEGHFVTKYDSKYDKGKFDLKRPASK